uniref:Uncharacterized protein n=1 Tax=Rhizobium laguerreae TaxID=1076926 RepID=A0A6N9ZFS8_9HYPH|nr:hypothetical protein [Rhizobium laguerreae]
MLARGGKSACCGKQRNAGIIEIDEQRHASPGTGGSSEHDAEKCERFSDDIMLSLLN